MLNMPSRVNFLSRYHEGLMAVSSMSTVYERTCIGCHILRSRYIWFNELRTYFNNAFKSFQHKIAHSHYMPDELPFLGVFRDDGQRTTRDLDEIESLPSKEI